MKADVDGAVNPCRKFFGLEVNARLMAGTMEILGMKSTSDTPDNSFVHSTIKESGTLQQKACLRRIAASVVDKYVLRKEKVQALIQKVMIMEDLETTQQRNQTEDGQRFKCRFHGCEKTFAHDGIVKRNHESMCTHNTGEINAVENDLSDKIPQTKEPEGTENDDIYNYQCAFLEFAMIIVNFFDAIKEGDGKRAIRCWKFQLPYLWNDSGSPKYALEALNMCLQINALLSPQDAHKLIWNRFACTKSGLGNNIPLDLSLEFINRLLKEVVRKLGPNATNTKAIDRYCKALDITKAVLDNFDRQCYVIRRSGKHYQTSVIPDLYKVLEELMTQQAFKWMPGRKYVHYHNCKSSILENFKLQDFFKWINKHKKNIALGKKAR